MEQIDEPKAAFAFLRPVCVLLTREQTAANARLLGEQLRMVSASALQQLQEYVLFPLRFVLRTPGPKKVGAVQAAVEGVAYVLSVTRVRSLDVLREAFSELCVCLCSPGSPGQPADSCSEELQLAVLGGLSALLHAACGEVLWELYEPAGLPALGAAVSLLLALAERGGARGVQTGALRTLQALLLQCDCPGQHQAPGPAQQRALGLAFACFLPGIAQGLGRVVDGGVRQGQEVTVRALRVWYTTVDVVMADAQLANGDAPEPEGAELGRAGQLVVRRTEDWARETSVKLAVILKRVISCVSTHQHWRVRLEGVRLSDRLLSSCRGSLGEAVGPLLDSLVAMVTDEDPVVREAAQESVQRLSLEGGGHALAPVLSENLHTLASSLPRLMRTGDDRCKTAALGTLLGYLQLLGPGVGAVLGSGAHLQRLSRALLQVLQLDVSDLRVVQETVATDPVEAEAPERMRKHFLYFRDEKVFSLLRDVCRLLGYYGDLYLLVDHFLDLYRESTAYRTQAAIVLRHVIGGAAGEGAQAAPERVPPSPEDLGAAVRAVVEEFTCRENWHLPTTGPGSGADGEGAGPAGRLRITRAAEGELPRRPSEQNGLTVLQLHSNAWQICAQLEAIGGLALALGPEFQPLVMTTLYPLLEKAGDHTLLVSQSALCALREVSRACGRGSLQELVLGNSDYLLSDVALNLQRLGLEPHAPRVLAAMLAHADADLLPLLHDVLPDLLSALDHNYEQGTEEFCLVLLSLLRALVRWFPVVAGEREGPPGLPGAQSAEPCCGETLDVRRFLLEYRREKRLAEGIMGDEEEAEDTEVPMCAAENEVDLGVPDEKAELPAHIAIAKDVMERCVHLLSHPSLPIRLKVLEVLELCILVLQTHQSELLPLAHRCWPALLQRLTNDLPLCVLGAFRVLCTLGETSGDFLRKRVSREVLPKLTASLQKQAPVSAQAGPVYSHTLAYKLQATVLQGLGPLCVRLELGDTDLELVSEACLPYLSSRQPPKLQAACISVFQQLMLVDPDSVWLTLNELHCLLPHEPPHPDLRPVSLAGMGQPRTQYTDNVLKLLGDIS
ncbi:TELO2-interacting protein 1 homolog isoform X2 [Conger conger]|nr:TELO2-interacting protein 1 homolog isoform X2 [Conger conger]